MCMTMSLGVRLAAFISFTSIRPSEGGREEGGREGRGDSYVNAMCMTMSLGVKLAAFMSFTSIKP